MNERGSGTTLVLTVAGGATVFAIAGMFGISVLHAYEQGRAGADLAALAAASALSQGVETVAACAAAADVATRNATHLVACTAGTQDVRVTVRSARVQRLTIAARAGFTDVTAPAPATQ